MKLKYAYELDTTARDLSGKLRNLTRRIGNSDIEFSFDCEHKLTSINVFIPNAKVTYNNQGAIEPLDKSKDVEAYLVANYVANVLQEETGKCDIRKIPDIPQYVPESQQEEIELEGKTFVLRESFGITALLIIPFDFSEETLNKYLGRTDALAIYSDAKRMSNPIGKYREFFRVLEYFFPFEGREFDTKASEYFQKYNRKYTEKYIRDLRQLRNQCTHARKDYITSNNLAKIEELRSKQKEIQDMAKLLINDVHTFSV